MDLIVSYSLGQYWNQLKALGARWNEHERAGGVFPVLFVSWDTLELEVYGRECVWDAIDRVIGERSITNGQLEGIQRTVREAFFHSCLFMRIGEVHRTMLEMQPLARRWFTARAVTNS